MVADGGAYVELGVDAGNHMGHVTHVGRPPKLDPDLLPLIKLDAQCPPILLKQLGHRVVGEQGLVMLISKRVACLKRVKRQC